MWQKNVSFNLLVVLRRKLQAEWVEGFSRLHCLLEGVGSLCKQDLLSHHIPTLDNQAKSICQLH